MPARYAAPELPGVLDGSGADFDSRIECWNVFAWKIMSLRFDLVAAGEPE